MFTPKFAKALKISFAISFLFAILGFLVAYLSFSDDGTHDTAIQLLAQFVQVIIYGAFWGIAAYLTDRRKEALIAYAIALLPMLYTIIDFFLPKSFEDLNGGIDYSYSIAYTISIASSFIYFGWAYFKKTIGIWLGILVFVSRGFFVATKGFDGISRAIGGLFRESNLLNMRIPTPDNGYIEFSPLESLVEAFYLLILVVTFWFVFNRLKSYGELELKFQKIDLTYKIDKWSFSILFLILRTFLLFSAFSLPVYLSYGHPSEFYLIFQQICFCISVYLVASIYRNMLTSYFAQNGIYPSWNYLCLNIPVIDWMALLVALGKKPARISPTVTKKEPNKALAYVKHAMRNFQLEEGNVGIKIAFMVLILLSVIISYQGFRHISSSIPSLVPYIVFLILTLGVAFWYMSHAKAISFIFITQSLLIVGLTLVDREIFIHPFLGIGLANIIVYFPLFHFEEFEFFNNGRSSKDNLADDFELGES